MSAQNPSENWQVLPGINPDAYAFGAQAYGPVIDTTGFRYMTVVLNIGDMVATSTLAVEVQTSLTSGGSYADFDTSPQGVGATIMNATEVATTDDNTVQVGEIDLHYLPAGQEFVRLGYTVGTANCDLGAVVILSNSRDTARFPATTAAYRIGTL
jgi:hypothetical protein